MQESTATRKRAAHTDYGQARSRRGDVTGAAATGKPDGRVVRAYQFALDPTPAQAKQLRSHCGAQRFAFNWGLRLVKANLDQRLAERSYQIAERDLTPLLSWSAYTLRKVFNQVKCEVAPWWHENSKEAYSSGLANLSVALSNWAASRSGNRDGPRMRFPRFKTKKTALSCRFTTGSFGLVDGTDRRHVKLPRIGVVRTHESTRKLARRVDAGNARIRSATISFRRGRWFVSFSVEVEFTRSDPAAMSDHVVGVDLGVRHLAVLSAPLSRVSDRDGMVCNPARLEHAQRALRRLQRQAARRRAPDKRRLITQSNRWEQTHAKVIRLHARVANGRTDALHQLTTALAQRCGVVVVEDLNVAGLLANHRLARRISDAGWGQLRRQLCYKTDWRGGKLVVADRFYPSSKMCSNCGVVKAKLRLSQKMYRCDACGATIDRDRNAARNLANLAARATVGESSPSCGATINEPAGNMRKTSPAGRRYRHGKPHEGNAA